MNTELKTDFAGTRVSKLVAIHRFFSSSLGKIISFFGWLTGISALAVWVSWIFGWIEIENSLGFDQFFLALFLIFLAIRSFLRYFIRDPEIFQPEKFKELVQSGQAVNIVDTFSVDLATALINISNLSESSSGQVLTELAKLLESSFIFARLGIRQADIITIAKNAASVSGVRFVNIAERALNVAIVEGHDQIEVGDMLVALSEADPSFANYLSKNDLSPEDVTNVVYWQTSLLGKIEERRRFLDPGHLHLTGGIGRDWAFGYTPELNKYSADLTEAIERQGLGLEIIGHEKETELLEQALSRSVGANAILVGEPGVGKRTTVLGFAQKIDEGRSLPILAHKHVIEIDVDQLISGLVGPGDFTQRLTQVFSQAANAGNVIIFIDGIEKILSSGEAGQVDASSVLLSYLTYPEISFLGTTDLANYSNLIAGDTALAQKFEKIEIGEPTDEEMIRILEDVAPRIESHYGAIITYGAIKETIKVANKFILDQPNPEKSIVTLEGAANTLAGSKERIIDASTIDNYVEKRTSVPVKEATGRERDVLLNLETELHKRIINQVPAVDAVAGALRRARAGVAESKKPIGSFLFLGPTGVGKTETAKALAATYFGSDEAMLRFDMSEYQNEEDTYRLIGSPAGYLPRIEGELVAAVRNKPFSLILFDEIEKANPDILNLFLQILDEGFITSSAGRKAHFKNAIIIATSNAGANLIRQLVASKAPYEQAQKEVIEYVQNEGIFKPEFLNRFSSVVFYSPLNQEQIKEVAKIMIRNLAREIYQTKGVILKMEVSALAKLAAMGYDPEMGARPMARVIEEQVENFLAEKILRGEVAKGGEVTFRLSDIK